MITDKKLNLDKELEYFLDGGMSFAQNVVVSQDGLTIQNEPAIVNFLAKQEFNLVGFVACNEEFVLFSSDNNVVRVKKDSSWVPCDTNWRHQGGEVFGTFTYNVNNELIIAISERNSKTDCPLKVINLDRDKFADDVNESVYTLTPDIPKSNIIDFKYVLGNKIRKGKYNFFIKYYINSDYETGWYPIGFPVFAYDNNIADTPKTTDLESIQAYKSPESGTPCKTYSVAYEDFYNDDVEYTNNNIQLELDINDKLFYTHYAIGCIINYDSGTEAKQTSKYAINTKYVVVNDSFTTVSIDELTIGTFNIYNVKTMCNYKDRLYLANYKEENRNTKVPNIDTSGIKIRYLVDSLSNPEIPFTGPYNSYEKENGVTRWSKVYNEYEYDYSILKNQWKTKPGRAAIYNFYIHYVYPNGNYTDGIKIGSLDTYSNSLVLGKDASSSRTSNNSVTTSYTYFVNKNTTTTEIYNAMNSYSGIVLNEKLYNFVKDNLDITWWTVEARYYSLYPEELNDNQDGTAYQYLKTIVNSNGDVLHRTPITNKFNVDKLIFEGIKMYPEFVGYFISYEKPEYITIGEGLITPNDVNQTIDGTDESVKVNTDLFDINAFYGTNVWKFYYPEFNIIGGKTNINRLIPTGVHEGFPLENAYMYNPNQWVASNPKGYTMHKNTFNNNKPAQKIIKSEIVSPNSTNNIGKEGYLKITSENKFDRNSGFNDVESFLAVTNDFNLYLAKDKKLISLGYIKYINYQNEYTTYTYGEENVIYNYDFYRCFSSIYWFRYGGIIVNTTESNPTVVNKTTIDLRSTDSWEDNIRPAGDYYYSYNKMPNTKYYPHIGILKYWHETHYPLFLKEVNQSPEIIFRNNYVAKSGSYIEGSGTDNFTIDAEHTLQVRNVVISPQYVNDLYKLAPVYYDYTGKLLVNYDKTLIGNQMTEYKNTIRRSDVLQSESIVNAWKYFRPENYKVITEDKGAINNVVGIGNYLFAHCEHSLFLFDITDSLQALDKNVQLLQPDTFETAYKEVFTADKGYGGLQDHVSWICDEFGYVFFDRSAQKIYRFDGGQLKDMTEGIDTLIKGIATETIFFGNDRPRNRIMANIRGDDNVILSYNLVSGGWVSTHSYVSNYHFVGLKDKLFLLNVEGSDLTINHYLDTEFNKYSLPVGNIDNDGSAKSFIDIVFTNPNYNKIKVLDFITYIINKEPADNFELLELEIFTNCCYSGVIDISQERKKVSEYKKPYYDFERWNFNYFRNVIDKIETGEVVDRLSGRIHSYPQKVQRGYDNALISGKYVVIRFSFKLMSKQVNVKDIHAYFKP